MAWYNSSWKSRVKVTVDNTKVAATLSNFPVLVDLSDLPAHFFDNVKSDGGDIRCTSSDGTTELARDVVYITTGSSIGQLRVNVPSLSGSVDTDIYIYYNNASATEPAASATYGRENAYPSAIKGSYPLQDDANDRTSTATNGTITGPVSSTGKVGEAYDFDGTDDEISGVHSIGSETYFAVAAWIFPDATDGMIVARENGTSTGTFSFHVYDDGGAGNGSLRFRTRSDTAGGTYYKADSATDDLVSAASWRRVWCVKDNTTLRIYIDGSEDSYDAQDTFAGTLVNDGTSYIGRRAESAGELWFNGDIDEVEYWTGSVPSANWISTDYNNQNSPATFYSVADAEGIGTFTYDVVLVEEAASKTFTFDVLLQEQGLTQTFTYDVLLQEISGSKAFTYDITLQERDVTKTYDYDVLLQAEETITFDYDALLQEIDLTINFSYDVLLQEQNVTSTFTYDVLLQEQALTETFSYDVLLQEQGLTETLTYDVLLQEQDVTSPFTYDIAMQEQDVTSQFTYDVLLQELTGTQNFSYDVLLQEQDLTSTFTYDAAVQQQDLTETFCYDVVLAENIEVSEVSTRRSDIDQILTERGTELGFIQQNTTYGTMGDVTAVTETRYNILCLVQPISEKDRVHDGQGLVVQGEVKAYFKHKYTMSDGTIIEVKEGDILVDPEKKRWRITTIQGDWRDNYTVIFKKAFLRSIGNEGSEPAADDC